jgi:hypothetical protein
MARTTIDPETRARWAKEEREFHAYVAARMQKLQALREREARRRARLRRFSLGLLGRS